MLSGGKVKPSEVHILRLIEEDEDDDDESDYDDDESDSSYDSDDTSEEDTTEPETSIANELDTSWDVKEMNDVLKSLESNLKRPLVW
jgi:hypothetical protein